jgi:ribonuclease D
LEIEQFEPNNELTSKERSPQVPVAIDQCDCEYVETETQFENLLKNLNDSCEIAVDLEHHSYRSYLGFTCLMQISTRKQDYIIDTIKLRSSIKNLNEIFTNKNILKIFHGSDSDIDWLQKDFGICVVNMFDTGQAARLLQYPHYSLSFLLQKFCNIQAQKQYQLSDWRQRPLTKDQITYAQQDTHYLLYIFDMLHNELLSRNLLCACYMNSKQICKKSYKKPLFYSKSYLNICSSNMHLSNHQLCALKLIYEWRDRIARENDESCEYVLKTHQLIRIAELLPREIYGILALCNPVSHLVEANLHQIHELIKKARDSNPMPSSETVDELNEQKAVEIAYRHTPEYDINSIINFPHDLSHSINNNEEFETKIEDQSMNGSLTLIKPQNLLPKTFTEIKCKSILFLENDVKPNRTKNIDIIIDSLDNPFELYLPAEYRTSKNTKSVNNKEWVLLKPTGGLKTHLVSNGASDVLIQSKIKDVNDTNLIPLKIQLRNEAVFPIKKKMKKTVDFTDAIIKYNEAKNLNADADVLGSDLIQTAINNNLAKIASQPNEFSYANKNFNGLFNANDKNKRNGKVFDPNNTKHKKTNSTGRVQKRSNPNSGKNKNKNATFKQD